MASRDRHDSSRSRAARPGPDLDGLNSSAASRRSYRASSGDFSRTLLLLHLLALLFISLIPFTTAVLARYPDEAGAVILYGTHLTVLGLTQYANWAYLRANSRLLESPVAPREVAATTRRISFGPVGLVVAMLVALVSPRPAYAIFYIVLIAYIFNAARDRSIIGR